MPCRVRNVDRAVVLGDRIAEADSFGTRFLGLMGRKELRVGHGLHIVPCRAIHTFFMRIPIDALFLDREGRVLQVYDALPPWRFSSIHSAARSVLELPAGIAAGSGTRPGDSLSFERY